MLHCGASERGAARFLSALRLSVIVRLACGYGGVDHPSGPELPLIRTLRKV